MPPRQVGAVSLPAQPTVLIGRQRELARIRELLLSSRVRLLTLVGPGGTGKTRLVIAAASAVASAFPSGVIFVDLTTCQSRGLARWPIDPALSTHQAAGAAVPRPCSVSSPRSSNRACDSQ